MIVQPTPSSVVIKPAKKTITASNASCPIGIIGLGVMGRNLALNIASNGFSVAGYDTNANQVKQLDQEAKGLAVFTAKNISKFITLLKPPRVIIVLVPAGKAVDAVIEALLLHLTADDLIIDAGNSYFKDTERRVRDLLKQQLHFMGVGISGGEAGARFGPSIMPGGSKKAYAIVQPIFEAIAAKVGNDPCVAYLGQGSAGHFVKMVHNGIEYALMQLITETYDLMKRGLNLRDDQLSDIYKSWNNKSLSSYLIEITSLIFATKDELSNKSLINVILPIAKQNGTGMWTSKTAMELGVPTPTIDCAVIMRDMSVLAKERLLASQVYSEPSKISEDQTMFIEQLAEAFFVAETIAYAQGLALLKTASESYHYELNLATVARVWRGGCIIRATLLEDIASAFETNSNLQNILLDPCLSQKISVRIDNLRQIVVKSAQLGIPTPGLMASLSYFDAYRSAWLPANLIQAQRDYFGSHTYQRIDMPGIFHTQWSTK